jgi:flagellar basal body-associated protein FliL
MLGISLPDAVLVGTLIVSVLAAWKGSKSGEGAKKADPVHPSSPSTLADIELLANAVSSNTSAVLKLTIVLEEESRRHQLDDNVQRQLEIRDLTRLVADLRRGQA